MKKANRYCTRKKILNYKPRLNKLWAEMASKYVGHNE